MKSFAVLALAVMLALPALAQHQTFAVNPDASEVQMTLSTTHEVVHGTFHSNPDRLSLTALLLRCQVRWSCWPAAARPAMPAETRR